MRYASGSGERAGSPCCLVGLRAGVGRPGRLSPRHRNPGAARSRCRRGGATSYAGEVLADRPLAYWRLDDAILPVAKDASGHGNDARYVGGVTLGVPGALAGDANPAVSFDGVNGYIDAGDKFAFPGSLPCSFEVWVKPTLDGFYHAIFSRNVGTAAGNDFDGYASYLRPLDAGATMTLVRQTAMGPIFADTPSALADGAFSHVAVTYDGATVRWYVNGADVANTPSGSIADPAATFW